MIISKEFRCDLAHVVVTQDLPDKYACKCKNLHGHTVIIRPRIKGPINERTRMILDYALLKPFKNFIDTYLDHSFIVAKPLLVVKPDTVEKVNELVSYINDGSAPYVESKYSYGSLVLAERHSSVTVLNTVSTTAEDMANYLSVILITCLARIDKKYLPDGDLFVSVKFKETLTTSAISDWFSVNDYITPDAIKQLDFIAG